MGPLVFLYEYFSMNESIKSGRGDHVPADKTQRPHKLGVKLLQKHQLCPKTSAHQLGAALMLDLRAPQ